jgi:hypothetical protein
MKIHRLLSSLQRQNIFRQDPWSASFLDLYLKFYDCGQRSTKIYDKRDDFNFKIINFPNMCSNIPASPAYGVYISLLIRIDICVDTLSLYIFTIWKSIVYNLFCRDGIYCDKILVSKYKLFKRSNTSNLTTVAKSVLKFMINGTTSILK